MHFSSPNPDIPALVDGRLKVVDSPVPVQGGIVGINSFGFGGSNVHVILRPPKKVADSNSPRKIPRVLQACGRTEEAVSALLQKGREHCTDGFVSLLNGIATAPTVSMPFRGYALLDSHSDVMEVQQAPAAARPVWYVCSGG